MRPAAAWRLKLIAAFATVYIVWGSTYLAIRVGVQELPPALFAGIRWIVAGAVLAWYARHTGQALPAGRREWRTLAIVGLLLIVGGNGLVVWAEQWVASNIAALIVASTALWIAGLGTLGPAGDALTRQSALGLVFGFAGVVLLLLPGGAGVDPGQWWAQGTIVVASFLWAAGTIYSRRNRPRSPALMSAALQMVIAGGFLCALGFLLGEPARWNWSGAGIASLIYLTVFGSLAFVAYIWLLHEATPAKLGTYAYVNPAIAVLLGWWLLAETLAAHQLVGMLVILFGVMLVTTARLKPAS